MSWKIKEKFSCLNIPDFESGVSTTATEKSAVSRPRYLIYTLYMTT